MYLKPLFSKRKMRRMEKRELDRVLLGPQENRLDTHKKISMVRLPVKRVDEYQTELHVSLSVT